MATENKPTVDKTVTTPTTATTPATPVLNWDKAGEHLDKIQNHLKTFEGKAGYNPFLYYNKFVQPLVDRWMRNERTPDFYNEIMRLPIEDPTTARVKVEIPGIVGLPKPK